MMQRLIVGDIHGCWSEFQELIDKAGLSDGDEIIAIGDFVDRGPETPRVLAFLRDQPNARAIQGNHERKHIRSARGEVKAALSQRITRQQLGDAYADTLTFFESLPLYLEFREANAVHGYWEPGLRITEQRETVLAGTMGGEKHLRDHYDRPWYELYDGDKPIIVGHHDYLRKRQPFVYRDRVFGIDTSCRHGGALTGIILPGFRLVSGSSHADYWREMQNVFKPRKQEHAPVVWDDVFEEIIRLSQQRRLVVVLDDFDQLIAARSDLPSALQRIWDHRLQSSNVMLFLVGSNVYAIEYDVLSYRAPLYGRAWWIAHLRPLSFAHLKLLFPNYSMVDRITLYACVGGVPRYLELLDPQLTLTQNLARVWSSPMMLEDADALLREQFGKPHIYAAVLESLARGITDSKQIAQTLDVEHRDVSRCHKTLERAKILRWEGPATARFPDTHKHAHLRIADQYLHFYFRCLAPMRSLIERGQTKQVAMQMRESLEGFIGNEVFPELCREWLYRQWRQLPFNPQRVGAYWGDETTRPIDIVAINHEDHGILLGKCNWSKTPIGEADVRGLIERPVEIVPQPSEEWNVSYAFRAASRSGFTQAARRAIGKAKCFWVNLDELDDGLHAVPRRRGRGKLRF